MTKEYPADTLAKLVERAKNPCLQEENKRALNKVLEQAAQLPGANAVVLPDVPESSDVPATAEAETATGPPEAYAVATLTTGEAASSTASVADNAKPVVASPESPKEKAPSALQKARTVRRQNKGHREMENEVVALQLKELAKVRKAHSKVLAALKAGQDHELQRLAGQELKEHDHLVKGQERERERLRQRHAAEQEDHARQVKADERRVQRELKEHDKGAMGDMHQATKRREAAAKTRLKTELADVGKADAKARKLLHQEAMAAERAQALRALQTAVERHGALAALDMRLRHAQWRHAYEVRHLEEELALSAAGSEAVVEFKKKRKDTLMAATAGHLEERRSRQADHLAHVCAMENSQLAQYERAAEKALKKRHLQDLKRQPRDIKVTSRFPCRCGRTHHARPLAATGRQPRCP